MRYVDSVYRRVLSVDDVSQIACKFEADFSYFDYDAEFPGERGKMISRMRTPFEYFDDVNRKYERRATPDVGSLRDLRLVSKAFNIAATYVLFRSTRTLWFLGGTYRKTSEGAVARSILCRANYLPSQIKHLKAKFGSDIFTKICLDDLDWGDQEERKLDSWKMSNFISRFSNVLSSLSQLVSLEISAGTWANQLIYDGFEYYADSLELDVIDSFMAQISTALSTTPFVNLIELRLSLPCTHNFTIIGQSIPDALLQRLKSICFAVTDSTGLGGSKQHIAWTPWTDEDTGGEPYLPLSNLQEHYPNSEHASAMFGLASRCQNLESLTLESTHRLYCDLRSSSTSKLAFVSLDRMIISAARLITLLPPSTLTRLWLHDIELKSGTWADVFDHLQTCEKLEYLNPADCSYAKRGRSKHLRHYYPGWDGERRNLWSMHDPDADSLWAIGRHLADKAGGRKHYPDLDTEQLMLSQDDGRDDDDDGGVGSEEEDDDQEEE